MIMTLVLGLALQGTAQPLEIPRAFWGEYNDRLEDCGIGNNDSTLGISRDHLEFHESTGELREMIRHSDGTVTVLAEHHGEGQTWTSVYQLRLSADRSRLTVIHPQTSEMEQFEFSRLRCPLGRAE